MDSQYVGYLVVHTQNYFCSVCLNRFRKFGIIQNTQSVLINWNIVLRNKQKQNVISTQSSQEINFWNILISPLPKTKSQLLSLGYSKQSPLWPQTILPPNELATYHLYFYVLGISVEYLRTLPTCILFLPLHTCTHTHTFFQLYTAQ